MDGAGASAKVVDALASISLGSINGLTFPTVDGSSNQVLQTNGGGVLSFGTVDLSVKANIASPTFCFIRLILSSHVSIGDRVHPIIYCSIFISYSPFDWHSRGSRSLGCTTS